MKWFLGFSSILFLFACDFSPKKKVVSNIKAEVESNIGYSDFQRFSMRESKSIDSMLTHFDSCISLMQNDELSLVKKDSFPFGNRFFYKSNFGKYILVENALCQGGSPNISESYFFNDGWFVKRDSFFRPTSELGLIKSVVGKGDSISVFLGSDWHNRNDMRVLSPSSSRFRQKEQAYIRNFKSFLETNY